ncbi:beta-ketoacyl-[acyl-carrier-protein] synthase family protein [Streptomonospora nanhaiensis]|uniref:Act minimal PKS ketosynthase (KS/KS alpha) n=1 Tax=Streptomonospora nanhaiensis TaxID=1323731 RepID=A0A853BJF6_9ACTN|nr:beta-ketoacyl-[acyl-carrier-protein] synthase family protein [Streptomonospora nanhaiensis]MBV2365261.1 beta-ketoacyl-[acyl-carrier-protein] synthase family protein [Streptomonospora nanhaiensis]NYI94737.1 act minimal PKS ketosynthase (KS/KS alpha) [Streptomonospora nanhaiensis]
MNRRVVITGLGAVAPGGSDADAFWRLLVEGRTATRPITLFDPAGLRCRIAAECDFDPAAHGLTPLEVRRMDRTAQLAVAAAKEALADSGLAAAPADPDRTGVSIGSAVGNTIRMEEEYAAVSDGGRGWLVDWRYAVPYSYSYIIPSSIVAEVAWLAGAAGPAGVVTAGCTSGLDAVGHAAQLVEDGSADVMITGAADAPLSPITLACFDALKATTPRNDDPASACRPFDRTRNGIVLGEGAAVLVLEEREHALARGAVIHGEILGYGSRANAYHMTGLRSDGRELAEAIRVALHEAKTAPEDIDYVNAHGSGTVQNDIHETAAVKRTLGRRAREVPMSSIKSMIGHSLGAIGALEIAACVLALRHQAVPPTANLHEPDPRCDLDYVPLTAREARLDRVLSVGSGFGGFQSAIVVAREGVRA